MIGMSLAARLDRATSNRRADTVRPRAPKNAGQSTDWSGLWFKLVEEDHGEFVGMRGGLRIGEDEVQWTFPSHALYDGLGGFVHVLRTHFPDREFRVPVRRSRRPSWYELASALLGLLAREPEAAAAWTGFDPGWRARGAKPGEEIATHFWSAEATQNLVAKARGHGVPLNSLLLSALSRASQPDLGAGANLWMMPVNMRGPVALARDTANQTGYLQMELGRAATPSDVHGQVKLALRRRDHWATWLFLNAGRFVGFAGMRRIYRVQMARYQNRPYVGSFSNLGNWDGVGQWCVCPPVTKTCPVGVGAITCDGRLALTIEAHASIVREEGWTGALMRRWIALLELGS